MECVKKGNTGKIHRVSTVIRNSKHKPLMGSTRCNQEWRIPSDEFGVKIDENSNLCKKCFKNLGLFRRGGDNV